MDLTPCPGPFPEEAEMDPKKNKARPVCERWKKDRDLIRG
jgi:hypothetical protein